MSDTDTRSEHGTGSESPPARLSKRARAVVGPKLVEAMEGPAKEDMDKEFKNMREVDKTDRTQRKNWAMTYPVYVEPMDRESGLNPEPAQLFLPIDTIIADVSYKPELKGHDPSFGAEALIYQMEEGQTKKYMHFQVAVAFTHKKRFKEVRDYLRLHGVKAWIRPVGASKVNWVRWKAYCQKRDKPGVQLHRDAVVFGDNPQQGQGQKKECATALAIDAIKANPNMQFKEFLEAFPALHRSGSDALFRLLRRTYRATERKAILALCFWGPTGTGKSYQARKYCTDRGLTYFEKNDSNWWDMYQGEQVVIMDDFRGTLTGGVTYSTLLTWVDHGTPIVQVKGSAEKLSTEVFIFTSAVHPRDWYHNPLLNDSHDQIVRRFNGGIYHFTEKMVPPVKEKKFARAMQFDPTVIGGVEVEQGADEDLFEVVDLTE